MTKVHIIKIVFDGAVPQKVVDKFHDLLLSDYPVILADAVLQVYDEDCEDCEGADDETD